MTLSIFEQHLGRATAQCPLPHHPIVITDVAIVIRQWFHVQYQWLPSQHTMRDRRFVKILLFAFITAADGAYLGKRNKMRRGVFTTTEMTVTVVKRLKNSVQ